MGSDINSEDDICSRIRYSKTMNFQELFVLVVILIQNQVHGSGPLWHYDHFSSTHDVEGLIKSAFHTASVWGENSLSIVSDPDGSGKVLRVKYEKGSYSGTKDMARGAGFYSSPVHSRDSMLLSYDIYFDSHFDFVKGGKLPGLYGGGTSCSGGHHSSSCFTTRFMWRRDGDGEVYAYIPYRQDSGFCDDPQVHCNPDYGNSLGRGAWRFKKGHWQNIAQYVHLNRPGHMDGYIQVFLDGHKVYEIRDLSIRTKDSVHIDGLVFSTFFGGSDSSWKASRDCYTYFKNFALHADVSSSNLVG